MIARILCGLATSGVLRLFASSSWFENVTIVIIIYILFTGIDSMRVWDDRSKQRMPLAENLHE